MTQAVRYEGIFSATAMPDGLRRSARVAELAKKARISEVRVTESLRKRGRPAGKAKTSTVKASEPLQKPPARAPLAEKLRTRAVKAPEPSKSKPSDVEYQPLSKKGRGRRRATKEAPIQEVEASTQLTPKHPLQQPARPALNSDTLRHLEAEADPHQERARAPLSRDALQQLETETANNPFPEGIESWKPASSDNDMPRTNTNKTVDSPKPTTVYNQAFLDELELRGVLEQQFLEQQSAPRVPKNYNDIHSAIQRERTHSPEPTALDYKEYVQAVFESRNEDEVQMTIFPLFFGLPVNIRNGHIKATNRTWTKRVAIMGNLSSDDYKQRPRPDYAEGLKVPSLPAWICKRLGAFAVPSEIMAFPNFTVELKRDLSMYTAHAQNRHNGSIASQAYHEYHVQILDKPDESWDIAKVGSIEFNGDIVVGNVHWVSKSDGDGTEGDHREYHMTRILCRFTYGLGYEDFKTARREARNFRDYFLNIRDNLREECKSLLDTTAAQIQGGTQSNPSASRIADEGPHLGNFDTEEADSEHAESQRANLEQDSNNRNSRKRGKSPMGKNPKIPSGGKPKKRKSGNAERVSKKNDTGLSFGTAQLGV